jgi:hypothetical protein
MITVKQFTKEFNYRHNFSYDDLNFLPKKFSNILFNKIPEAWVSEIDRVLSLLDNVETIQSISQIMGFLVIKFDVISKHDINLLHKLDENIKLLDIDLYDICNTSNVLN